jgi:hypothetical protein
MEKKSRVREEIVAVALIIAFSLLAVCGIMVIREYTGWASVPGEAGYITEMTLKVKYHVDYWAGVWGFVVWIPAYAGLPPTITVGPDDVTQVYNMFFDCMESDGDEIYASTTQNIDWESLPQMMCLRPIHSTIPSLCSWAAETSAMCRPCTPTSTRTMRAKGSIPGSSQMIMEISYL